MKKFAAIVALVAIAGLFVVSAPEQAEARPQYLKAFVGQYDIAKAKELKCGVCHGEGGKKKKVLSDYGKALGKAIGAKNCKDADTINAGLKKAEGEKAAGSDKTYGEILKGGELPPLAP